MRKKKKVLYVITKSNWGGAGRYVFDLATSLPKERFTVTVVLGGEGLLKEKLISCGIRTIALPYLGKNIRIQNDIKTFFALIKIFRKEQPHIIHLNSSKVGILGAAAARVFSLSKVVFTAHGWAFNERRPVWQKILFFIIHLKTVFFSHATIAVSHKTKKQISFLPFIKNKIFVIHNGIKPFGLEGQGPARLHAASKNPALQKALDKKILWVGTIAELHKTKGLTYAIEAIKKYAEQGGRQIIYVIVGEGEERKSLEKQIQELHLEEMVFLAGFIPDASRLLWAFDIFLLSSVSEAFAYVFLEAGFAKLPVIASAVGDIPEIIENKNIPAPRGIVVPPRNSAAIAHALAQLTKDDRLRLQLGEALRARVEKEFSFDAMLQKTISVYEAQVR